MGAEIKDVDDSWENRRQSSVERRNWLEGIVGAKIWNRSMWMIKLREMKTGL